VKITVILFLILITFVFFVSACEPGGSPIIENTRNEKINIIIQLITAEGSNPDKPDKPVDYGVVQPKSTKKLDYTITYAKRDWVYRIEAVDSMGKVVFSHEYNMDDIEKVNWKITIPPL
jgi:hypothetical protein